MKSRRVSDYKMKLSICDFSLPRLKKVGGTSGRERERERDTETERERDRERERQRQRGSVREGQRERD